MNLPTPQDVRDAATALRTLVNRTPVLHADALDAAVGGFVVAKAECLQITGSFKVRGALNRIRTFTPAQRSVGLITISAGNAALGAAHAAKEFGARLTVVMPENAVPEKLAAVEAYGCVVVKDGVTSAAIAFKRAAQLQTEQGLTLVHPFDDPMVISGAATATLELLEDHPLVERLFVPTSGGGSLAGAVLAAATLGSRVEIIGVQPSGADGLVRSLVAGLPTAVSHVSTVADGLTAPGPGQLNFAIIRDADVQVRTVSDDEILAAMRLATHTLHVVVEPAGATALAGLLAEPDKSAGTTAVLLSGSNVNWELFTKHVG